MGYKYLFIGMGAGVVIIGLIIVGIIIGTGSNTKQTDQASNPKQENVSVVKAEKIEVIHFHATQQCWSCITVGEYALKTIKEKFPEEYANGTIVYKDINGELPENKDMVIKYQAGGSSLFINSIADGKDNIEEDVTVWRLVSDEEKFKDYFENKIKQILGK